MIQIQKKKSLTKNIKKNKYRSKRYKLLKGGLPIKNIKITIRSIDNIAQYEGEFSNADNVLTIKNNIYDQWGIEIEDQRITFLGNVLNNDQILSDCGLTDGSTIILEDTYESQILTIKLAFIVDSDQPGNYFIVRVHKDSTILDLKNRASELFKIGVQDIELSLDKIHEFDNEQILSECGLISNESVIYVNDTS